MQDLGIGVAFGVNGGFTRSCCGCLSESAARKSRRRAAASAVDDCAAGCVCCAPPSSYYGAMRCDALRLSAFALIASCVRSFTAGGPIGKANTKHTLHSHTTNTNKLYYQRIHSHQPLHFIAVLISFCFFLLPSFLLVLLALSRSFIDY